MVYSPNILRQISKYSLNLFEEIQNVGTSEPQRIVKTQILKSIEFLKSLKY